MAARGALKQGAGGRCGAAAAGVLLLRLALCMRMQRAQHGGSAALQARSTAPLKPPRQWRNTAALGSCMQRQGKREKGESWVADSHPPKAAARRRGVPRASAAASTLAAECGTYRDNMKRWQAHAAAFTACGGGRSRRPAPAAARCCSFPHALQKAAGACAALPLRARW